MRITLVYLNREGRSVHLLTDGLLYDLAGDLHEVALRAWALLFADGHNFKAFLLPDGERGNLAHSCSLKDTLICSGGLSDFWACMIQLHTLHAQAEKVLFSSQTSSLSIRQQVSHRNAGFQSLWIFKLTHYR
jgi:hypothetical protein